MTYQLRRVSVGKRGSHFSEIIFDLWNEEFRQGYEIKVTIWKYHCVYCELFEYAKQFTGQIKDISKWDKIIRNIREYKLGVEKP